MVTYRLFPNGLPTYTPAERLALYARMRAGDRDAREQLILCAVPLVHFGIARWKHRIWDRDELESLCFEAIVHGVDRWEPERNTLEDSCKYQMWGLAGATGRSRQLRAQRLEKLQSLAMAKLDRFRGRVAAPVEPAPHDWRPTQQEEWEDLEMLFDQLKPQQREALSHSLDGASITEVGRRMGMTKTGARWHLRHAEEMLRWLVAARE